MMEYIQPIIGFFILLLLGAIFSENVKAIKIRYLVSAVVIQVLLALVLIKVPLVSNFFEYLSYGVMTLKEANDNGLATYLAINPMIMVRHLCLVTWQITLQTHLLT